MLVLARKLEETVRIGREIEIRVLEITPTTVRLGVNAPREIDVHRGEVAERIAAAKAG